MGRWTAGIAVATAVTACNPNAFGVGSAGSPTPSGSTDTEGQSGSTTSSMGSEVMTSVGDAESSSTVPPADTTSTDTDPPPQDAPLLVFADAPMFDFGDQDIVGTMNSMFVVTNEGQAPATELEVQAVTGGFSVASGTCDGQELGPGESCEVRVVFGPSLFGVDTTELRVAYLNPNTGETLDAGLMLSGRGVGITENLIANGGGEEGNFTPPTDWSNVNGLWRGTTERYYSGERCIFANQGGFLFSTYELRQQVDLTALTTWGDGSALEVSLHAVYSATSTGTDDDSAWVELHFIGGGGGDIEEHMFPSTSDGEWVEQSGSWVAPKGTAAVDVVLHCQYNNGTFCNGYFDDIELVVEYPPS